MTVSEVYPVGAESGAQAKSLPTLSRRRTEGKARVYSKALVEANRKPDQEQDRVPRR